MTKKTFKSIWKYQKLRVSLHKIMIFINKGNMVKKVIHLTEEELQNAVNETVLSLINEIGYRKAALVQGANYNARTQKSLGIEVSHNIRKGNKSDALLLPSLNQAINDNFPNLSLLFSQIKMRMEASVYFKFQEVKFIDAKRFVLKGVLKRGYETEHNGCIEFNFNSQSFYEVKFYGGGSIRRLYPMEIEKQISDNYELYKRFLTFITNYIYSQEDYENDVDNQINNY
jgi:hypothetical protein